MMSTNGKQLTHNVSSTTPNENRDGYQRRLMVILGLWQEKRLAKYVYEHLDETMEIVISMKQRQDNFIPANLKIASTKPYGLAWLKEQTEEKILSYENYDMWRVNYGNSTAATWCTNLERFAELGIIVISFFFIIFIHSLL